MMINDIKTKIMCFGSKDTIDIDFNGFRIEQVQIYKYLGCIIRSVHKPSSDIFLLDYDYLCDNARKALFAIKRKLKCIGSIPVEI